MEPSISEQLTQLLDFIRKTEKEYEYYSGLLKEAEKKETDLLHFLELDAAIYRERCKISTQLRKCLLERRQYKDCVEERAPLAEFFAKQRNKALLDRLGKVVGDTRKVERYHQNRSYTPRVLERQAGDMRENRSNEEICASVDGEQ